jgi:hypothetical protein
MVALAIIAIVAVAGIADASVQRHAAHPGVEPWRTS